MSFSTQFFEIFRKNARFQYSKIPILCKKLVNHFTFLANSKGNIDLKAGPVTYFLPKNEFLLS